MGVDRTDYIVVGVDMTNMGAIDKLTSKSEEEYEELYNNHLFQTKTGRIVFIDDVMCGEYFIVGEILQASDNYRDEELNYNFFGKENQIEEAKVRVKAFIKEHFDVDVEPSVIVRTQFS